LLSKRFARFALAARLHSGGGVEAVYRFGKNTRTSGLAHAPRTAKQVGVCQMLPHNGILERGGNRGLPHHRIKGLRSVFPRRYYKSFRFQNFKVSSFEHTKVHKNFDFSKFNHWE
jgi:hypothetical protein